MDEEAALVQGQGQGLNLLGPGSHGTGLGLVLREGRRQPGREGREGGGVESREAAQAVEDHLDEGGRPARPARIVRGGGELSRLSGAAMVGLRPVDADLNGIGVERQVAQLAFTGVIITHDPGVKEGHKRRSGGALPAVRARRRPGSAGPARRDRGGRRCWRVPRGNAGDLGTEHRGRATPVERFGAHVELADSGHAGIVARRRRPCKAADAVDCAAPCLGRGIGAIVATCREEPVGEPTGLGGKGGEPLRGCKLKPWAYSASVAVPRGGALDVGDFREEVGGITRRVQVAQDAFVQKRPSRGFNDLMRPGLSSAARDLRGAVQLAVTQLREGQACRTTAERLFRSRGNHGRGRGSCGGNLEESRGGSCR